VIADLEEGAMTDRIPTDDGMAPAERISPGDLAALASDVGPVPTNVGAVMILVAGADFDLPAAEAALKERARLVPRLRQRLTDGKRGTRRPVWVDVPDVDVGAHRERVRPWTEPASPPQTMSVVGFDDTHLAGFSHSI
jgi:hypothetical protein